MDQAEINEFMVGLSTDPEFQPLLRSGSAVLLWRAAPLSILWASPAAEELAQALVSDDAGTVSYAFSAHSQISALAEGRAPRHAHRLEKLRFETSALAPLSTCACRMMTLPDGQEVLLTSFLGMPPRLPPHMRKPAQEIQREIQREIQGEIQGETSDALPNDGTPPAAEVPPKVVDQPEPAPVEPPSVEAAPEPSPAPPSAKPLKRIVRFVWEADADGRFVSVSDSLAEVVGADSAAIVGLTISDVLESRAHDPLDIVAELFARGETWSGRKLYWRIDQTNEAVQIDLAGMTVHDRARNLVGFRGFGLCRTDVRIPWASPDEEAAEEAQISEESSSEAQIGEAPSEAHPAAALFEAASQTETQVAETPVAEAESAEAELAEEQVPEAEPVANEERADPQQLPAERAPEEVPEEASEPAPEDASEPEEAPARMTFLSMGGSVGASMGDAAPLPLKVVEDEPAPSAPSEEASSDAVLAEGAPSADEASPEETPPEQTPPEQTPPGHTPAEETRPDVTSQEVAEAVAPLRPVDAPRSGVKPLSNAERSAFREIARALGARFEDEAAISAPVIVEAAQPEDETPPAQVIAQDAPATEEATDDAIEERVEETVEEPAEEAVEDIAEPPVAQEPPAAHPAIDEPAEPVASPAIAPAEEPAAAVSKDIGQVLDRLPFGVIVHRGETALFANSAILDLIGYEDMAAFVDEGGLPRLFQARPAALAHEAIDVNAPLAIGTRTGDAVAVEVRLSTVDWYGAPASMLTLREVAESDPDLRLRAMELDMLAREQRLREQSAILDTATDGVIVLDDRGRILSLNRAAEALFGYEQNEVAGEPLMLLLATESHLAALDYLEGMRGEGMQSLLNDGREVIARVRQGGTIPLFMTLGRVGDGGERKFCAVLRDITAFKKAEGELLAAKRAAEDANAHKSDFLAKISHEIRTPLNAIIGFAEVMIEERFGAIGNERYKDYVSDIHSSGQHVISLVNDLLDLAKIEAGRMELTFTSVKVNELVSACVALLQPQAARDRIVLRTSFIDKLPPVVADERSLRQITLNLLSNAVKFTDAGGQVIVSTAMTDAGEVVFRVRDTGIGMSETEVEAALEPFRQLATSRKGGGTGLGLPLTKALVEANRGALTISSRKNEGTLVEVVFPPTRVLAE